MENESWARDDSGIRSIEMPCRVVALEAREGRLFAALEDGRLVDFTDWFSDNPPLAN